MIKMNNVNEVIELFSNLYEEEVSADNIKKGVREDLKEFAQNNSMSIKAVSSAYALYKKYKSGKYTSEECEAISELSDAVDKYFSTNGV